MFVYLGSLFGPNGWKDSDYLGLAGYVANASISVLSIVPEKPEAPTGVFYDARSIALFFNVLAAANRPVFVRVGVHPSTARSTATRAVADAIEQMEEIAYLFKQVGCVPLLGGFALDSILSSNTYQDGSRLSRNQINDLVLSAHALGVPILFLAGDGVDEVTLAASQTARAGSAAGSILAAPAFGASALQDVLVHINPLFPSHIYDPVSAPPAVDWPRLSAITALARKTSTSTLIHAVAQSLYETWSETARPATEDELGGLSLRRGPRAMLQGAKQVLNAAGFAHIGLAIDSRFGVTSNMALDTLSVPYQTSLPINSCSQPTGTTPTWGSITPSGDRVIVSWQDGSTDNTIVFDETLTGALA